MRGRDMDPVVRTGEIGLARPPEIRPMAKAPEMLDTAELVRSWTSLRPDLDPTSFSIIVHLVRLAAIERRRSEAVSARHGITGADARVLMFIRGGMGGQRPSKLGDSLDLSRATVTYRTDRLLEM